MYTVEEWRRKIDGAIKEKVTNMSFDMYLAVLDFTPQGLRRK